MSIWQSFILGLIQGLTEFLPISSSGHLILVPYLFRWETQPLYFDVALHWGTLMAVAFYFWSDWKEILKSLLRNWRSNKKKDFFQYPLETRLGILIGLGTIPAVVFGFLLQGLIEERLRSPYIVIVMLILVAIFMWWVEEKPRVVKTLKSLQPFDGFLIGLSQAMALIPGTSRSGITISTGILRGLSREEATRYSFLLSTPIIFGAGVYELIKVIKDNLLQIELLPLGIGFVTALLSGFVAIKFLMGLVKKQKLTIFVIYRVVLALIILFLSIIR